MTYPYGGHKWHPSSNSIRTTTVPQRHRNSWNCCTDVVVRIELGERCQLWATVYPWATTAQHESHDVIGKYYSICIVVCTGNESHDHTRWVPSARPSATSVPASSVLHKLNTSIWFETCARQPAIALNYVGDPSRQSAIIRLRTSARWSLPTWRLVITCTRCTSLSNQRPSVTVYVT